MQPIFISSRQAVSKNYTYGTHRICDPEETFHRVSKYFSATGITRIADVTGLDSIGIPVCISVRPNAKSISVSQGKGATLALARTSAAMEAIELYHAENVRLDIIRCSYRTLSQQVNVCNPKSLNIYPNTGYHEDLPIPWVKGYDLITQKDIFVPYNLVHCSFLIEATKDTRFIIGSNGLASGNHLLEAISHGICEVVERDATHLWTLKAFHPYAKTDYVNLDTIGSPACQELLRKLDQAGIATYVWSMTADVEIPIFGCAIMERQATTSLLPIGIYQGFGCHLSKVVAFIRALTEAVQSRLTFISGSRDDLYREEYDIAQSKLHRAQWQQPFEEIQPTVDFRNIPSFETDSLTTDVATQLSLLKKAGFEQVIAVDLTQPQLGIPVVRIIIPKMCDSGKGGFRRGLSQRAKDYFLKQIIIRKLLTGDFSP